ncbi:MAG: hypothetical protein FJ146_16450 [Deltaproteobacteria bacterium]|nr:hypothetical protein [Deltaproteobacteria bacterium]
MAFTKKRLAEFDDVEQLLNSRLSPEQRAVNHRDAAREMAELKALQEDLSRTIIAFMANESIGVPVLTERLGTSTRQAYKIVNAEANLTLASLVELGRVIGRRPRIVWDEVEESNKSVP